jgi:ribosomal-protein-alanine N-acetyltransferase
MNFHTARLSLRPMRAQDSGVIFAIMGDAQAMRFWDRPAITRLAVAEEIVAGQLAAMDEGDHLYWTVSMDATPIGSCDLSAIDRDHGRAEMGFLFRRDHWGHGYAREALAPVIAHGFGALGLMRLSARIHVGNQAAKNLLERLGFAQEGLLRGYVKREGVARDCALYAKLRD